MVFRKVLKESRTLFTFALPFFMGGIMYLPSLLMDLEPEDKSRIGLIYKSDIVSLINRFKNQCDEILVTQEGDSQFIFKDLDSEQEALKDILDKRIDGYLVIPNSILDTGRVKYFSQSLSNIKIYNNLRRTLNQLVIEKRMLN